MTPRRIVGLVLAFALVGGLAGDGGATSGDPGGRTAFGESTFGESTWPFLLDQWGRGRAFRCRGAGCGAEARLYVRSKVGFCDCFNHVDDDDDIDRLTDFDLIGGDRVIPLAPGRQIAVGGQPARRRTFHLESRQGRQRRAVAVVVATDCQAVVGMLVSDRDPAPAVEAAALDVLSASLRQDATAASRPVTEATR